MVDTLSVVLSGLTAQGQRFAASANNIANASTVGVLPTAESPGSTVYKPLTVSYAALMAGENGGGVRATVTESRNGYSPVFDPSSIYANNEGLIAAPNVDLSQELVTIMQTKLLFKANTMALKTQNYMLGQLLHAVT